MKCFVCVVHHICATVRYRVTVIEAKVLDLLHGQQLRVVGFTSVLMAVLLAE